MQIIQVASELAPIAKVGGLGDVLIGLTRELTWKGHNPLVIIPFYGVINVDQLSCDGRQDYFQTVLYGQPIEASISYFHWNDVQIGLLDTQNGYFRQRSTIYGDGDEISCFIFFVRAVAEWLLATKRIPDVIHVHDWQAALLPSICRLFDSAKTLEHVRYVFTVHNFEYQGFCHAGDLERVGIFPNSFGDLLQDPTKSCLNLIKAGLLSADFVTTVSPTYAKEVLHGEEARGLQSTINTIKDHFEGVLNGVDYSYWNPEVDHFLVERYAPHMGGRAVFSAKRHNKEVLCHQTGIPFCPDKPLIASVTRLVQQKGVHLIYDLFSLALKLDVQCILLGSVPDSKTELLFAELDLNLREQGRGAVFLLSDESFAHRVYAAADLFVVPSLFEPCGLTQLIALKYGAIPIVRRTGGLADTIIDMDTGMLPSSNGFSFDAPDSISLTSACTRALQLLKQPALHEEVMLRGMLQDFSWHKPCNRYISLYQGKNE
jgi:starch synthase